MFITILNWIGTILTIWGSWEVSKLHPNTVKVNLLFAIACICLIITFITYKNCAMITMYCVLLCFAIRGIYAQLHANIGYILKSTD